MRMSVQMVKPYVALIQRVTTPKAATSANVKMVIKAQIVTMWMSARQTCIVVYITHNALTYQADTSVSVTLAFKSRREMICVLTLKSVTIRFFFHVHLIHAVCATQGSALLWK